ncbi:hypothetical protein [Jiangella aurantiaca]|nr:hypothetical protein [Jiangella aurantiaca]
MTPGGLHADAWCSAAAEARPTMIDFELLVVDFGPDDTVTRVYFSQS